MISVRELTPTHSRAARAWLNISQSALSKECGLSEDAVGHYEKNRTRYAIELTRLTVHEYYVNHEINITKTSITGPTTGTWRPGVINHQQSRAARAWLGLTRQQLATMAGHPVIYLFFFENDRMAHFGNKTVNITHIPFVVRDILEQNKVTFLFDEDNRPNGIRVRS